MDKELQILDLVKEYHAYLLELRAKEPYHVNVLDNVRILENDHTRILLNLLRYPKNGHYIILESFLKEMGKECEQNPFLVLPDSQPLIEFNKENIDGLIEYPQQLGVIIENKINNAVDQDSQIERYVDTVIAHGIPSEQVIVFYLTLDGSKEVSEISYTAKARELLEDDLHYIPIDYKHHVLPWLQNTLIPIIKEYENERLLLSTIELYADYLKGRFNLRLYQKQIANKMNEYLKKQLNLDDNTQKLPERINIVDTQLKAISELQESLLEIRDLYEQDAFNTFSQICKDYWENEHIEITINNQARNGYYQLNVIKWLRVQYLHMEFMIYSNALLQPDQKLVIEIHLEGNHELLKQELCKHIRPIQPEYDDSRALYHAEYDITDLAGEQYQGESFVSMPYNVQKLILNTIFDDIRPTIHSIDNIISNIPTINAEELLNYYQQSINSDSFIQRAWKWGSPNYIVLDEKQDSDNSVALDIDCRTFEESTITLFKRGGDILRHMNGKEEIKLNEQYSFKYDSNWGRYVCVLSFYENTNENMIQLVNSLLNYLKSL